MDKRRIRVIKTGKLIKGTIVYWMSREQRAKDNWALLYAQQLALQMKTPLVAIFCLVPDFLGATIRQYDFMLKGLMEVELALREKNINFYLLKGEPKDVIAKFVKDYNAASIITDFDPLRIKRQWKQDLSEKIDIPIYEVDAHNIVPCWLASSKQEYSAYTFRRRLKSLLKEFLTDIPRLKKHPFKLDYNCKDTDWEAAVEGLHVNKDVSQVSWIKSGQKSASQALSFFIKNRLDRYNKDRNNPAISGQSNLSPYLHFGQLSPQFVAMQILKSQADKEAKQAFLEELIVRRELSDNFCFYNKDYDNINGFPAWAKETLQKHMSDERQYIYSMIEFERALTHDELWNAAQMEMLRTGKMHGYMRMYWAKKILEWSESPQKAMEIAIYLNDKYELDGRDPNGYTGISWSIGGVHDRAWGERPVFGKIRYMSYHSLKSKFDIRKYIDYSTNLNIHRVGS